MGDRIPDGVNKEVCDTDGNWRKSPYSMSNGQCVEIAILAGRVGVRDSQAAPSGPVLRFERRAWSAFLTGLRA